MFKWIIIFTLFSMEGDPQITIQGDSVKDFGTKQECLDSLAQETEVIQDSALSQNLHAEIDLNQCFFLSALSKKGVTS